MSRKKSYLTVTDQFCGAGGSSQGVRRYAQRSKLGNGLELHLALNHWKLAIETHATNFPDAIHECTDIQACDPRRYPSTDILITSPECTNHSVAKGRKAVSAQLDLYEKRILDPVAERSRATMWDVHRFAEFHRYRIIITENVVDARAWIGWRGWITAMQDLGYHYQPVFLNSMFCITPGGVSAPQSRDRLYVVFWRKGQRKPDLDIRPKAPCPKCGIVEAVQRPKPKANPKWKYGRQYVYVCSSCGKDVMPFYYAAINAIDWSLPAERIGDRKTPLKPRTLERIAYGLKKYGNRPLSVSTLYGERVACRVKDASTEPMFGQHSTNASAIVHRGNGTQMTPMKLMNADKNGTISADRRSGGSSASAFRACISPFMVETKYSHAGAKRAKGVDEALPGQTGQQSMGVALPFIMDGSFTQANGTYMNGGDEPMNTQATTQSKAVVIPPALMVDTNYFTEHTKPLDGALPAQTSANKLGLAFLLKQRGTEAAHVKSAASGVDEAVGTISAGGNHHALITGKAMAFLASQYNGSHVCKGMDEGMGALACTDRHALVAGVPPLTVDELYFRMLKAHEVKAGMAFDPDYVVLGSQRDQVKQLGNAVTPPALEILTERCVESLM